MSWVPKKKHRSRFIFNKYQCNLIPTVENFAVKLVDGTEWGHVPWPQTILKQLKEWRHSFLRPVRRDLRSSSYTTERIKSSLIFVFQVVRSSGSLEYKDKLITAIKSTIHLKCKEAATLGATVGSFYLWRTTKYVNKFWLPFKGGIQSTLS